MDEAADLLRLYLDDVGRHPVLTRAEEVELSAQVRAGQEARARLDAGEGDVCEPTRLELEAVARAGEQARDRFAEANLRLVVFVARKYAAPGVSLLDLIQDGNVGLLRAVDKFDGRRGFAFSTYAIWWIRQAIARGKARNRGSMTLPHDVAQQVSRVHRTRGRLEAERGRPVSTVEIADDLDAREHDVARLSHLSESPVSLSLPVSDGSGTELGDVIEDRDAVTPFDAAARSLLAGEVERLLGRLSDSERVVIRLRFGLDRREPCSREQVSTSLRVTRERIRQIETRAMRKLRRADAG
jgi:RNA polymerase primary sigma factor